MLISLNKKQSAIITNTDRIAFNQLIKDRIVFIRVRVYKTTILNTIFNHHGGFI